jgi:O-antigen/teichoic acid export membrane protein
MSTTIFSKISAVFLPTFSLIQDDKEKLKNYLLKLTEIIATFSLPFFTFLIVYPNSILTLVYSPEVSTIAIPFRICCIFSFLYLLSVLIMNVAFATGNPDKFRQASLVRTIVFLILLYPATKYFGLIGAALSALFSMCLALTIQIRYLKPLLDINALEYSGYFVKGIKYSFIVLIPGSVVTTFVPLHKLSAVVLGAFCCFIAWCFGLVNLSRYKKELI